MNILRNSEETTNKYFINSKTSHELKSENSTSMILSLKLINVSLMMGENPVPLRDTENNTTADLPSTILLSTVDLATFY